MKDTTEVSVKVCSKCRHEQPITDYWLDKTRHDKLCPQCKTCMQANAKARRERGQERAVQREWRKRVRNEPSFRASRLIADARQRNSDCNLTLDWLTDKLKAGHCEVTGLPFDQSGNGAPARAFAPSLDRVDPTKGYTKDNTKAVVWIYNRAKGVHTHEDVVILAKAILANG